MTSVSAVEQTIKTVHAAQKGQHRFHCPSNLLYVNVYRTLPPTRIEPRYAYAAYPTKQPTDEPVPLVSHLRLIDLHTRCALNGLTRHQAPVRVRHHPGNCTGWRSDDHRVTCSVGNAQNVGFAAFKVGAGHADLVQSQKARVLHGEGEVHRMANSGG